MRTWILLPCLLLLSLMTVAQQSPSSQTSPNAVSAGGAGAMTVIGCVSSINGYFTLGTRRGDLYRLKGDHDSLLGYNGKEVAISGTVTSSEKARTLQVSKIKKISDTCQY
jgi:hypothetical protein